MEATNGPSPGSTYIHVGPWNSASRSIPALRFSEAYGKMMTGSDLPSYGPYTRWFHPASTFVTQDDTAFTGVEKWDWLLRTYGSNKHSRVDVREIQATVVFGGAILYPGGEVEDIMGDPSTERKVLTGREMRGDLVYYHHELLITPILSNGQKGEAIPVRRVAEFVLGPAETKGQGEDGWQMWRGKVWWDTAVIKSSIANQEAKFGQ
ncbi:hypothetical protein NQ176_g2103 [Zarea fungicola]|uniref:Uncharacterized protein n=1 Tax=Zarea fungicola TaxID=93591 RepID=A0ACC1NR73_9HYPO|nr:hypothetical protein NQ176_g2103 [Lecanicillium fungicola]